MEPIYEGYGKMTKKMVINMKVILKIINLMVKEY